MEIANQTGRFERLPHEPRGLWRLSELVPLVLDQYGLDLSASCPADEDLPAWPEPLDCCEPQLAGA